MNAQITKLAVVSLALLVALIVATTYWQTWATAGLADRQDNSIQRVAQFTIKRGRILAADGTPLAVNRAREGRRQDPLPAPLPAGRPVRAPRRLLDAVAGALRTRAVAERLPHGLEHEPRHGAAHDLRPAQGRDDQGQRRRPDREPEGAAGRARRARHRCGAVVAIEPKTGKVLVLASSPIFNPNLVERNFGAIQRIRADCRPAAPLLNRATDGLFVPGSTFKVVTTAAALASGHSRPTPVSTTRATAPSTASRCATRATPRRPRPSARSTSASRSRTRSTPSTATSGRPSARGRILDQAKRFGFYSLPPLETPVQRAPGERPLPQRPALRPARSRSSRSIRAGSPSGRSTSR